MAIWLLDTSALDLWFIFSCNLWKTRDSGMWYADVYDGFKWQSMEPWLREDGFTSLLLQFNIDYFNPYSHIQHSFGAIYMTVLNLTRELRYQENYVILVG